MFNKMRHALAMRLLGAPRRKEYGPPMIVNPGRVNQPQWNDWSADKAIREGYRACIWVYGCIKKRAEAVASVPWIVEQRARGGEWESVKDDHPLQMLMDYPNPDMDRGEYWRLAVTHADLTGDSYSIKLRTGGGQTRELWPSRPDAFRAVPGLDGRMIAAYDFQPHNGQVRRIPAEEVLHIMYTNPESPFFGMSPLRAAAKATDSDNAAANWQKVSFDSRGVPDGVFTLNGDAVNSEDWERARQQVREQYAGQKNNRTPWVVANAEWHQMGLTAVEMDFMASRKFNRTEICFAFGVPEILVEMSGATFANAQEARKFFWQDTVVPLCREYASHLNMELVPEFGDRATLRIRPDFSQVDALQTNMTEKVTNADKLWRMGVPFNNLNELFEFGFEPVEGGDVGFIGSSLLPMDIALEPPEPAPAPLAGSANPDDSNAPEPKPGEEDDPEDDDAKPPAKSDVRRLLRLAYGGRRGPPHR